jgi:CBS-domain-containing membrane protein
MKVSDIMTRNPMSCTTSSSVQTAAELMLLKDTGILPVTEGAFDHKVVGVVTDRDLCTAVLGYGRDGAHVWIRECMSRDPACCRADDDVEKVIRLMGKRQVRRIPVVDEKGNIRGIVAISDLIHHHAIAPAALFDLMEKICQPGATVRKHVGTAKRVA